MNIEIKNPSGLPLIDYRKLKPLQGKLKSLTSENYQKLKKSIADKGFFMPFFTWTDSAGTTWILDGHQRHDVLSSEKAKPYKVPHLAIEAGSLADAKEKLLVITSKLAPLLRRV